MIVSIPALDSGNTTNNHNQPGLRLLLRFCNRGRTTRPKNPPLGCTAEADRRDLQLRSPPEGPA